MKTPEQKHPTRNTNQKLRKERALGFVTTLGCCLLLGLTMAPPCLGQMPTCTPSPTISPTATPSCSPSPTITPIPGCTPYNNVCSGIGFNEDTDTAPHSAPTPVALAQNFQPPDGSILQQRRYLPDPAIYGDGPYYTVVTIHGGGFYSGSPHEGGVQKVSEDLRDAGYLVLSVTYRLAPCELIKNQPDHFHHPESGRPPEQTDDIKSQIRAARADPLCNGHVAVLGGSAGASHAVFVGFDKTPSPPNTYPNWCQQNRDDRPECVISLSCPFDFSDRGGTQTGEGPGFVNDIENYTNTCDRVVQKSVSPAAKLKSETEQSFKPLFAVSSDNEAIPPSQSNDLFCGLQGKGINPGLYQVLVLRGRFHAFATWLRPDADNSPTTIRCDVLAFLDDHFKNPP